MRHGHVPTGFKLKSNLKILSGECRKPSRLAYLRRRYWHAKFIAFGTQKTRRRGQNLLILEFKTSNSRAWANLKFRAHDALGASTRLQALIKFARSKVVKPRTGAKFIAAKLKLRKQKDFTSARCRTRPSKLKSYDPPSRHTRRAPLRAFALKFGAIAMRFKTAPA